MNDEFLTDIMDFTPTQSHQNRCAIHGRSGDSSLASQTNLPPEGQDDCGETFMPPSYPQSSNSYTQSPVPAKTVNPWDPRLILDLAVAVDDLDDILLRYGLSRPDYNALTTAPLFRRELAMMMRDVRENGASFSAKARIQAESYLPILDDLVYSDITPANVRLEAVRSTVRWGRLDAPKNVEQEEGAKQPMINISINF